MRIEICGGIASGKTTLCEAIGTLGPSCTFESFQDNPFWHSYTQGDRSYDFETEVTFLMQHCAAVKLTRLTSPMIVCDFSFLLDKAYADISLDNPSNTIFQILLDHVATILNDDALMIFLRCDPDIEMTRIAQRGRPEEVFIKIDLLRGLSNTLDRLVEKVDGYKSVMSLDSGRNDFTFSGADRSRVLDVISSYIRDNQRSG